MTMRYLPLITAALLASLTLSACQTLVRESIPGDWIEVVPGSTLRLNQPVQIPQGQARAFFATGRSRAAGASQDASCALEVRRIDQDGIQTVAAGEIRITRVQNYVALVSQRDPRRTQDGQVRFQLAEHADSGGSQMVRFGYHFWLDDTNHPNLMRLTCLGRLDDPAYTRPPTLVEIQAALGDLATLNLGPAGADSEPR
jgi:hypothetical protein